MGQTVIDASVVVKFFLNEVYSKEARELRDAFINEEIGLITSSLFEYEVINGIRYSKDAKFSDEMLKETSKALKNYEIENFDLSSELANKAIDISFKYNITFYDAVYVALALITHSSLYTADEKLIKAVNLPFMKHIKDFERNPS